MFDSVGSPLTWGIFFVGFFVMLALDLGVFNRKPHRVSMGEALRWSIVWVSLSLTFNAYVYYAFGQEKALEFMSAYFIEEALSVDNIFVFVVLFRYMKIPQEYLHRVLFAGILGALILRDMRTQGFEPFISAQNEYNLLDRVDSLTYAAPAFFHFFRYFFGFTGIFIDTPCRNTQQLHFGFRRITDDPTFKHFGSSFICG